MGQAAPNARFLEKQLAIYEEQPEEWKGKHDAALRCLDFETLLSFAISLAEQIHRFDESWRLMLYKGLVTANERINEVIDGSYRRWLKPRDRLLQRLEQFEKEGFEVRGAAEFRSTCREVEGILTPDPDFFSDQALVQLRDEAIDAQHNGQTIDIRELSD